MFNNVKDHLFEGVLKTAFGEYVDEEDKTLPSDEELARLYPISKKTKRKFNRAAKAQKYSSPLAWVYTKRVVAVLLIAVSLSFGVLLTSSEVRGAIADTVIEWCEKYLKISFSEDTDPVIGDATVESLQIGYIPSGFVLEEKTETENSREYLYTAENGDYLMISIDLSAYTDVAVDAEQMEYETVMINNNKTYIAYNADEGCGVITSGNADYTIWVSGIAEREELIKITENIK